jgi:hypothetical protein
LVAASSTRAKVVGVALLEALGDGSKMLNLVEEAFDQVAIAVKEWAERRDVPGLAST